MDLSPAASPAPTRSSPPRGPSHLDEPNAPEALAELHARFDRMLAVSRTAPAPDAAARDARLARLRDAVMAHKDPLVRAVNADFGSRSAHETLLAEVFIVLESIGYARRNLHDWMRPEPRDTSLAFLPARVEIRYQPLGLVGIVSPWNYPIQLALVPIVAAVAAGNRVMLKPSEYTPETSRALDALLRAAFSEDEVQVVLGGPEVGAAFSSKPWDHLFFTGSTSVGRHVMRAAAENLVPVTLELGGKSPALVHGSYDLRTAAKRIMNGKLFNAGQTCVAPDYALVPEAKVDAFVEACRTATAAMYPTLRANPDYTSIVHTRHVRRISALLEDAASKGARLVTLNPAGETMDPAADRKLAPTLVLGATDEMTVMHEEIFGPVMPVIPYRTMDDALAYVNARPRPLALYYFDDDGARVQDVLDRTVSGGVCVNETLLHVAQDDLPFGGVGPSGMGHYHGREGFETFSKKKGVFYQSRVNGADLIRPPYGKVADAMLKILVR